VDLGDWESVIWWILGGSAAVIATKWAIRCFFMPGWLPMFRFPEAHEDNLVLFRRLQVHNEVQCMFVRGYGTVSRVLL
jgi:hypothetical protein